MKTVDIIPYDCGYHDEEFPIAGRLSENEQIYIMIDQDGSIYTRSLYGEEITTGMFHRTTIAYRLSGEMQIGAINLIMDAIRPMVERLIQNWDAEWDGSNWIGHLDDSEGITDQIAGEIAEWELGRPASWYDNIMDYIYCNDDLLLSPDRAKELVDTDVCTDGDIPYAIGGIPQYAYDEVLEYLIDHISPKTAYKIYVRDGYESAFWDTYVPALMDSDDDYSISDAGLILDGSVIIPRKGAAE